MNGHVYAIEERVRSRRTMSVAGVAAHLDHRLYRLPDVAGATGRGCLDAAQAGFAAVICRPENVGAAARALSGTAVAVATAVCWDTPPTELLDTDGLVGEALALADQGANEVALVATKVRMGIGGGGEFERQTTALVASMEQRNVRVRVILDTEDLTSPDIVRACRRATDAGVWMVQGGSWRGQRTGFTQVRTMRRALGPDVLLKWTQPVRSLETLLLCVAEGVARFNADVGPLMVAARRSAVLGTLNVPLVGTDY
jgi:deoxyribose-phosphate aldolase